MGFRPWKALSIIAKLGRPILRLAGVKDKTVAGKIAEGAELIDQTLAPPGEDPPSPEKPKP